ncbi:MAG: DUF192 domain-containing protein [Armatimonadetes bacterium]|nr:DUF192 domain-containing protein [Armatimonadota bacterium]
MKRAQVLTFLASLALVGCQGGGADPKGSDGPSATTSATPTPSPSESPTATPSKTPEPVPTGISKNNLNRQFQLADLKTVEGKIGGHKFKFWICDTEDKRREGMMFLKDEDFKDDEGFIFIFPEVQKSASFWMHNTFVPLDICYFDKDGRLLNVGHGKPMDETGIPADGDVLSVVELRAGTADKLGFEKGTKLELSKPVKATE